MFDSLEITGRAISHVQEIPELRARVHRSVADALLSMREAARADGIGLEVVSAFRDFPRQIGIWNAKFRGERALNDRWGNPIDYTTLNEASLIDAILIWSALPGASRHHWGTDVDVIDRLSTPPDYRPQLVQAEFAPGGVYERLNAWLATHMDRFGFFRPYTNDRGGVMPEPWHLSYAPVAVPALSELTESVLREAIAGSGMDAREAVLARLPELYRRFVREVDPPHF